MKQTSYPQLLLTHQVADEVRRETLAWIGQETGGLWLGRFDGAGNYVVSDSIAAGPKSVHRPGSFSPDEEFQNRELSAKRAASPGIDVIGMWHSHPGSYSTPSQTDELAAASVIQEWGLSRSEVVVGIAVAPGQSFSLRAFHMAAGIRSFQEVPWRSIPDGMPVTAASWVSIPGAETYLNALLAAASSRGYSFASGDFSSIRFSATNGPSAVIQFPAQFPFSPALLHAASRRHRLPIDARLAGHVNAHIIRER
jgi:integrative and conjugative element protein (TIGR02256 family)